MADEIDELFARTSATRDADADRAAIDRARSAVLSSLQPVRRMANNGIHASALFALFVLVAVASGTALGLHGLAVLSMADRVAIFAALAGMGAIDAVATARVMRPASGVIGGPYLLGAAALAFPALFASLFHGYDLVKFVPQGIPCLTAGLAIALPMGALVALILRRGFVLSWAAAGITAGLLSGLAGLGMLELHCPNLKAIHVMVWHMAVVLTSGVLGYSAGRAAEAMRRRA